MVNDTKFDRRSVLKGLGASAIGTTGVMAASGNAAASDPVSVRIFRDDNTSYSLATDVRDAFNDAASSELPVTVEAEYEGYASVDTVWNALDDAIDDPSDASSTRGFRQYVADSSSYSWSEGRCFMWLTDYSEWPGDNGDALGSAYGDNLFDHDCTDFAPHWAAGSVDSARDTTDDVVGTFMHEYGHISMHTDHNHHKIYDYDTPWYSDSVSDTSCMTGSNDEDCLEGQEGSYTNTDFGPTMADCVEALVEYQSPKFEHDANCQISGKCHSGWQLTGQAEDESEVETSGPGSLPVEAEAVVDNFPGEPPAIE